MGLEAMNNWANRITRTALKAPSFSLAAGALLAASAPTQAATLLTDGNGKLTGASGVDVKGTLYDVSFLDGSCASLFSGCNEATDFQFTSLHTAKSAAQSLLDQVFVGTYDKNPAATAGCTWSAFCYTIVPFASISTGKVAFASAVLAQNTQYGGQDGLSAGFVDARTDTQVGHWGRKLNFAQFTPTTTPAVPEPATWAMLLLGFLGVGSAVRRRNGQGQQQGQARLTYS